MWPQKSWVCKNLNKIKAIQEFLVLIVKCFQHYQMLKEQDIHFCKMNETQNILNQNKYRVAQKSITILKIEQLLNKIS